MQAKTILVVDSEETLAFFLAENLAELRTDCQVETVHSGEEALDRIAGRPFDLVLTALHLPGISGLEVIRRLHRLCPQTPVILISGGSNERARAEARRLEAQECITMPFPMDYFLQSADEALFARVSHPITLRVNVGVDRLC